MMDAHRFAGFNHFGIAYAFLAVNDVFPDRALKQPCILKDHAELLVNIFTCKFAYRGAVDEYVATFDFIEAHVQIDRRCLARAGWPDNGDFLAGSCFCRKIMNDCHIGILVPEAHIAEFHFALCGGDMRYLIAFVFHFFFTQKFKNTISGGGCGLETVETCASAQAVG
jgi:hypothetical protein